MNSVELLLVSWYCFESIVVALPYCRQRTLPMLFGRDIDIYIARKPISHSQQRTYVKSTNGPWMNPGQAINYVTPHRIFQPSLCHCNLYIYRRIDVCMCSQPASLLCKLWDASALLCRAWSMSLNEFLHTVTELKYGMIAFFEPVFLTIFDQFIYVWNLEFGIWNLRSGIIYL